MNEESTRSGPLVSRRSALRTLGAAAAAPLWAGRSSFAGLPAAAPDAVRFFFVTDTHYLARRDAPSEMDETSAGVCRRLVETLNALPGEAIPAHAGGGTVGVIRGVLHGGDVVDSADKRGEPYRAMQVTELAAFERDYGLTGGDGLLRYPVYEVHGNHDGPRGDTPVVDGIRRRNKNRVGLANVSANGLHYSWDWGRVHFVNLGIVVGEEREGLQRRRYAPLDSLAFLRDDLRETVGDSGRPVVVTHHVDAARYAVPYQRDEERFLNMEWHPQDVGSFFDAIRPYNVVADLFGHTHVRDVYGWEGGTQKLPFTEGGVDLFNGDNGSHFGGGAQAFLYFEISGSELTVREVKTTDGWRTREWSDRVWAKAI